MTSAEQAPHNFYDGYHSDYPEPAVRAASGDNVTFHGSERLAGHVLQQLNLPPSRERKSILDFGGGDGAVAKALATIMVEQNQASFVDITLVDFHENQPDSEEKYSLRPERKLEAVSDRFDIVLASAILEHIPRLRGTLACLFQRLRKGAYFYARTPYVAPIKRCVPGFDMTFPAHVHDLGLPFWQRVKTTFGLDADVRVSRPSPVETAFGQMPLRTALAYAMKFPAYAELLFRKQPPAHLFWPCVGGWEVVLQQR